MRRSTIAAAALLAATGCAADAHPAAASDVASLYRVCVDGGEADTSNLHVSPLAAGGVRVSNPTDGVAFEVLYDEPSRAVATRCIPLLGAVYGDIARMTGVQPRGARWHGVVFNASEDLPDRAGERWPVRVVDGGLDQTGRKALSSVIPHEQTHAAVRMSANAMSLPRWYREGVASWVELALMKAMQPDEAEQRLARLNRARAGVATRLSLQDWGPLRFQVPSGAGGARPTLVNGQMVMQTGPAETEMVALEMANYAAATALFHWLEGQAGREKVVAWVSAVAASPPPARHARPDQAGAGAHRAGPDIAPGVTRSRAGGRGDARPSAADPGEI